MPEGPLFRLVELVRRELGAKNARIELGGDPPDEPNTLFCELSGGFRVVAVFAAPPPERELLRERLDSLVQSFSGLATAAEPPPARVPVKRALTASLADLAARAGGTDAIVVDTSSPVLWGCSEPARAEASDVELLLRAAAAAARARAADVELAPLLALDAGALGGALSALEVSEALRAEIGREVRSLRAEIAAGDEAGYRRYLLAARAVAWARRLAASTPHPGHLRESMHEKDFGGLVRAFANIYLLVIAFEGSFSELHAEAAMLHALPRIERLVLSLPPTTSPGGGPSREARVVSLAGRRNVRRKR